jgi:hypothetical protein
LDDLNTDNPLARLKPVNKAKPVDPPKAAAAAPKMNHMDILKE